ncbi:hypothetical protein H375_6210 [Rickettsia prowazekii str. Breinl]|nr:tRNA-dihydrouridine synthase [Rickettsia prowazekii str. NMRC Madrid E]AGJ02846.1 hypothetical protein H375_6210 [Rickettsia prowazekii str. Breinl]EOB09469.1 hypothetical protein H377_7730 [Rickettsia prowazekii str. Cairo 3]EOB10171.1 hypothetical protein H376_3190 [Rickettsia prowazekii str. GvF12]
MCNYNGIIIKIIELKSLYIIFLQQINKIFIYYGIGALT